MNKFGALPSIPDLRDRVATATQHEFPRTFALKMPKVKDQGDVGSCVAHSLALVAEYFEKQETGNNLTFSTGFIYGNRLYSLYKSPGMRLRDAIKTMTKFGTIEHKDFPENIEVPEAIELFDSRCETEQYFDVTTFEFNEYFKLSDNDAIKQTLMDGRPVIFSMYWYNDIELENGVLKSSCDKSNISGSHCMVIYGWDDIGWKVQNSWGKNWGNKGCFILPYNIPRKETWGVTDYKTESSVVIKKPFSSTLGSMVAKSIHKFISIFYKR